MKDTIGVSRDYHEALVKSNHELTVALVSIWQEMPKLIDQMAKLHKDAKEALWQSPDSKKKEDHVPS